MSLIPPSTTAHPPNALAINKQVIFNIVLLLVLPGVIRTTCTNCIIHLNCFSRFFRLFTGEIKFGIVKRRQIQIIEKCLKRENPSVDFEKMLRIPLIFGQSAPVQLHCLAE